MTTRQNKRRTAAAKRPLNSVLTSFVVAGFSSAALGNPHDHTLVQGNTPVVTESGTELSIATDGRTILNWDSFSIASGERTRFLMSGADQAVLNRVTGGTLSQIDGSLESNGRVYLINPNGVIIGATGMVQTQSFIASTRDLADEDFLDGSELTFLGTGSGEVHNLGTIQAADGDVALIGERVINSGFITAPRGVIALAAGDEVMLAEPGSSRLLVRVTGVADSDAVQIAQTGDLSAAQAELQAVGGNMYALAVNAGGVITATGVENREGRIYLTADGAQINVPGTLTATNDDGSGGSIHIDSGIGYDSTVLVNGTLDASSTSTGGGIHIDSSYVELEDGAHLVVSGGSGNAGGVFIGSEEDTNQVLVAEGASIEANSLAGDAGNIDLSGAGVYFHGQLQARGGASQARFNIHSGEGVEYTGLADLRAYGDEARFGSVTIDSAYANLSIAPAGADYSGVIDADALATQLNYGNVTVSANGEGRYIDVFAPLSWHGATRLTLQADDTIDINQAIDASNGALHLISRNAGVSDLEPATITVRDLWLSAAEEVNLATRVVAQNVTLHDIGGRTWLTNEQNQIGTITFTRDLHATSGEVDIVDSAEGLSLTTSNIGGITYATDGNFRVRTSGDLTLASAFQTQVGGDVTLIAGGVLRNQSTASAHVFGTSDTGLGRTRVYAAGVGEHGGLEGPAQYNVSYSLEHEAAASTGFYYSGNAPQDPGPSDPDPVDPVDPPQLPEPPPAPPSQIIQTALDGNSFEQLNRPPQDDFIRLAANLLPVAPPPPPADPASWSTAKTDQLETLAQLADLDGAAATRQPRNPDGDESQQQPTQRMVDQLDDMIARIIAFLQALQGPTGKNPDLSSSQLEQMMSAASPDLVQLHARSPAAFNDQMAIIMAKLAMEQRNAVLDEHLAGRNQAREQLLDQVNQMREAAQQMQSGAITNLVMTVVQAAAEAGLAQQGTLKIPTANVPTDLPQKPDTKVPAPTQQQNGDGTNRPQPPLVMPPVSLPAAVQARLDALRALEALQNRP